MATVALGIAVLVILAIALPWAQEALDDMLEDIFNDWL